MDQNYRATYTQNKSKYRPILIGFGVLLAILLVGGLIAFGSQSSGGVLGESTGEISSDEVKSRVKSIIMVNEEENPTVAEIRDAEKLKSENPELYANVENGDYLLVYSDQAIIYSPDEDKLVKVAPITLTGVDQE